MTGSQLGGVQSSVPTSSTWKRDPREVRRLQLGGERRRIREVHRVVDEDADAGEDIRGRVRARRPDGREESRREGGDGYDPANHAPL